MRLVQHNATAHRTHHASQNDEQSDATDVLLHARIILQNDLVEERRDGVENAHIDAVRQQQQHVVAVQQQALNRPQEGHRILRIVGIVALCGGRRRRRWFGIEDCATASWYIMEKLLHWHWAFARHEYSQDSTKLTKHHQDQENRCQSGHQIEHELQISPNQVQVIVIAHQKWRHHETNGNAQLFVGNYNNIIAHIRHAIAANGYGGI